MLSSSLSLLVLESEAVLIGWRAEGEPPVLTPGSAAGVTCRISCAGTLITERPKLELQKALKAS